MTVNGIICRYIKSEEKTVLYIYEPCVEILEDGEQFEAETMHTYSKSMQQWDKAIEEFGECKIKNYETSSYVVEIFLDKEPRIIDKTSENTLNAEAKRPKPNSDYIRLDLKPKGEDLKEFCVEMAENDNTTITKYLQKLVRNEKNRRDEKTKEALELFTELSEDSKDLVLELMKRIL